MANVANVDPAWTTAQKLVDRVEPCDIIEIRYEKPKPPKSHFIFNIRKGWCVHVICSVVDQGGSGKSKKFNSHNSKNGTTIHYAKDEEGNSIFEGFKDAVDFVGLAGRNLCRINNLDDIASSFNLQPRSRKDALQIARAGLAEGAVIAAIKTLIPGDPSNGQDISKMFALYWKYNGAAVDADSGIKFLDKTIAVCGLVLVLLAAVVATTLSF